MKNNFYLKIVFILVSLFVFRTVNAADIFCTSNNQTVTENQTFTVTVNTDTAGIYINSIEGLISFPVDLLSVDSISSSGSVFSMWVEQPTFSNINGTISFNGGVPNPGFRGTSGKVISVLFKAKKAGNAQILFNSASIYANDGLGTNVASSKRGIAVNIISYQGAETIEQAMESEKLPTSPVVVSSEIASYEDWYSLNKITFSWDLSSGVSTVQTLLNSSPTSIPSITYSPPIKEKTLKDLGDGIHYLHIRFKNGAGWSKTTHFKFKTDTTAPVITSITSSASGDDLVLLQVESTDATSGINKYKILLEGGVISEVGGSDGLTKITLPPVAPGRHDLSIIAYDRAGNLSEKVLTTVFPENKSPQIIKYSESIEKGEKIEIMGTSYPNTDVRIWLKEENLDEKSYITRSLEDGSFTFTSDFTNNAGLVSFYAEAVRSAEVISPPSYKYFVVINKPAFIKLSLLAIEILSVAIPVLLLLVILLYLAYHFYHRLKKMRRKLLTDLDQTESEAHKIFKILNEDIKQSIKIFKNDEIKDKLTENDKETMNTLSRDVEEAEKYFAKRLESIEEGDL
ncbi:MAG: hypothetical protein WC609_03055 [Candidatus Paceibacterota bacterium]|jgi:hypothetical protein